VNVSDRRDSGAPLRGGRLARDGLDLGDLPREKNDANDPTAHDPQGQPDDRPRIFAATD
jgi:hypothetical protein